MTHVTDSQPEQGTPVPMPPSASRARWPRPPASRTGTGPASPGASTSGGSTSTWSTRTRAPRPEDEARGEEFLARLREVCEGFDGDPHRARRPDPRRVPRGAHRDRRLRDEDPARVRRSRAHHVRYGKALMLAGSAHPSIGALLSAHQSIGVPEPVKLVGTPEQKQALPAPLRGRRDLGLPAHRARRRLRPGPDGEHGHPDDRRHGIPARRGEAVDHQRRRRRAARRHGAGAEARDGQRGGITAFVVEGTTRGHHRRAAQRVHGPQGARERPDPVPPGAGARREPARRARARGSRSR